MQKRSIVGFFFVRRCNENKTKKTYPPLTMFVFVQRFPGHDLDRVSAIVMRIDHLVDHPIAPLTQKSAATKKAPSHRRIGVTRRRGYVHDHVRDDDGVSALRFMNVLVLRRHRPASIHLLRAPSGSVHDLRLVFLHPLLSFDRTRRSRVRTRRARRIGGTRGARRRMRTRRRRRR
jgi:hypothetical protein